MSHTAPSFDPRNPFPPYVPDGHYGGIPPEPSARPGFGEVADGYLGFWHEQGPELPNAWRYKYSGGLGTYCHSHQPFSVHCPEVGKTFFTWGGTSRAHEQSGRHPKFDFGPGQLLHLVGEFDHGTKTVGRPRIVLDKWCGDAHDNPVIQMDGKGHLWVYSPSHGNWTTPSHVHRSRRPFSIEDGFETVHTGTFAYPQAFWNRELGFVLFHVLYQEGRGTRVMVSRDGFHYDPPVALARIGEGSYQVAAVHGSRMAVAFDQHPKGKGLDHRTNLYYMESTDGGLTWRNLAGEALTLPLVDVENAALVRDAAGEGLLVYVKDLVFDEGGNPCILYVTSRSSQPGPEGEPRTWTFAKAVGKEWAHTPITRSGSNYDHGSLYERDGGFDLIAPIGPGAQPGNPGGEVVWWRGAKGGRDWTFHRALTAGSRANHTYVRRGIRPHPDFLAFWADGNPREPSPSRLYFCNDRGDVFRLPEAMEADRQAPVVVPM